MRGRSNNEVVGLALGAMALTVSACGGDGPSSPILRTNTDGSFVGATSGDGGGGTTLATTSTSGVGTSAGTGLDASATTSTTTGTQLLGDGECAAIRRETPEAQGGVDVVFVLDTSGSMLHARQQVQNNLARFITEFENTPADTRVVMITTPDPAAGTAVQGQADRYRFIDAEVDSSKLFDVALQQFPAYQDFLRPGAATQFVMITDDDDDLQPANFRSQMEDALGKPFTQHAIASERVDGGPCLSEIAIGNPLCIPGAPIPAICGAAAVGETYYELADVTGGVQASVCDADWTPVFDQLKTAVIEAIPLPCDYPLADAASQGDFNPNEVQVRFGSSTTDETEFPYSESGAAGCSNGPGWYYDDASNPTLIQLCPMACESVEQGGAIDIVFGCPPTVLI